VLSTITKIAELTIERNAILVLEEANLKKPDGSNQDIGRKISAKNADIEVDIRNSSMFST